MPFLDRPDAAIYYEVRGRGPAVVFAHGLGGNQVSWWQQLPFFAERWTCVAFAARGFAPSRAPAGLPRDASLIEGFTDDLAALIDELALDDVRLVAQSMGGWAALEYALAHPERVRALVLADTTGTVRPAVEADPAEPARLLAAGIHPAAGRRMASEQPSLHGLYRMLDALSVDVDKDAVRAALFTSRTRSLEEVASLAMPVLGIAGAEDVVIAPAAVRALVESLPRGRFEEVPVAGHSVYFERAETFNRLVAEFLGAIERSATGE